MSFYSISLHALGSSFVIMLLLDTVAAADISDLCKAAKDDKHSEQVVAWNDPIKKGKRTYAVKLRCSDDGKSIEWCQPELLPDEEWIQALSTAALQDLTLPQEQGLVMTCLSDELPIFTIKDLGYAERVCGKRERKKTVMAVNKNNFASFTVEFECRSSVITECSPTQDMWYRVGTSAWFKPRGTFRGYVVACHKFAEPTIVKLKSEQGDVKYTVKNRPAKERDLLV